MKLRNPFTKLITLTMAVTALVCAFGLLQPVNGQTSQPVRLRGYIYDATGRLLAQTDPIELRPSQAHTVEIKRDDLRVAGEELVGRLQVRAGFQVAQMDGPTRNVNIPVWLEVVNTATGITEGGSYYTGSVTVSSDGF